MNEKTLLEWPKTAMDNPNSHISPGVLYRTGLTDADYDDAIRALQDAKRQPQNLHQYCTVCEDTGHTAEACHHNPLVMARRAARVWRCFHCGFETCDEKAAREHFGHYDFGDGGDQAVCVTWGTLDQDGRVTEYARMREAANQANALAHMMSAAITCLLRQMYTGASATDDAHGMALLSQIQQVRNNKHPTLTTRDLAKKLRQLGEIVGLLGRRPDCRTSLPPDLSKLNDPKDAPDTGKQFIAWATDDHGLGFNQPHPEPRWVVVQWAPDYPGGKPFWRWSVPGRSTSVTILGWLPLPWTDEQAARAAGRRMNED